MKPVKRWRWWFSTMINKFCQFHSRFYGNTTIWRLWSALGPFKQPSILSLVFSFLNYLLITIAISNIDDEHKMTKLSSKLSLFKYLRKLIVLICNKCLILFVFTLHVQCGSDNYSVKPPYSIILVELGSPSLLKVDIIMYLYMVKPGLAKKGSS